MKNLRLRLATTLVLSASITVGVLTAPAVHASPIVSKAQKTHQYGWSAWVQVNDGYLNGMSLRFRKGDNSFAEKPNIFYQVHNRYNQPVNGEITFDVVNSNTGAVRADLAPFDQKAETVGGDDAASWCPIPDAPSDVKKWDGVRVELKNIRMKVLRMPDSEGSLREVYPKNELAEREKKIKEEAARKQQADQQARVAAEQKAAQDKQARETAQKQQDESRKQQAASAEQRRQEAARQAEAARQKAEEARQAEEQRRTQAKLDSANRVLQNIQDQTRRDAEATARRNEKQKDNEAESKRRREEIESRFSNPDSDPEIRSLQSDLQDALDWVERKQSSQERSEAEVERYRELANDSNPTIAAINRIAQASAQRDVDSAKREKEQHQNKAKRIERQIEQARRRIAIEKEAALKEASRKEQAEREAADKEATQRESENRRVAADTEKSASISTPSGTGVQALPAPVLALGSPTPGSGSLTSGTTDVTPSNNQPENAGGSAAVKDLLLRIDTLMSSGKRVDAERLARQGVKSYPNNADLNHRVANTIMYGLDMTKTADAVRFGRTAVQLQPTNVTYRLTLAFALSRQDKLASAVDMFREGFKLAPNSMEMRNGLANYLSRLGQEYGALGKWKQAVTCFREAVQLKSNLTDLQKKLKSAEARANRKT